MVVSPDSSIQLLSVFGGMMFNIKIKERDLPMDYLRFETQGEKVIANSGVKSSNCSIGDRIPGTEHMVEIWSRSKSVHRDYFFSKE